MKFEAGRDKFEAWVEVVDEDGENGRRLSEYKEETRARASETGKEETTQECYLECEEGKDFVLMLSRIGDHGDVEHQMVLSLNGQKVGRSAFLHNKPTTRVRGPRLSTTSRAALRFQPMQVSEDDKIPEYCRLETMGEIKITIRVGKYCRAGNPWMSDGNMYAEFKVLEKLAKMTSTISLQQGTIRASPPHAYDFTPEKGPGAPAPVHFVWKYRNRALLTVMGIIENDPQPPNRPQDPSATNATDTDTNLHIPLPHEDDDADSPPRAEGSESQSGKETEEVERVVGSSGSKRKNSESDNGPFDDVDSSIMEDVKPGGAAVFEAMKKRLDAVEAELRRVNRKRARNSDSGVKTQEVIDLTED